MAETFLDQEFLEYIVKAIVDHPEAVKVIRTIDANGIFLRLQVHKEDMGQVVGKGGATAVAIRSLLRIVGIKNQSRISLKIDEPEGSTFVRPEQTARPVAPVQTQTTSYGPGYGAKVAPVVREESATGEYVPSTPKFDGPVADELKF